MNASGETVVSYTYDAWGNHTSGSNGTGTLASTLGQHNPLRYRGYVYDVGTGLYYLQSRYYNPELGRFVNADGLVATGQDVSGNNMFAYCGNNPVCYSDSSGYYKVKVTDRFPSGNAGSSSSTVTTVRSYDSANEAAIAFAAEIYSSSSYTRLEYSTEIYSMTVNGETKYYYTEPAVGEPHKASGISMSHIPSGGTPVAYAHTHPNSNRFSAADKSYAEYNQINAYMIGPNLLLQRYNLIGGIEEGLGYITPIPLNASQKAALETYKYIWDGHFESGKCPSNFKCDEMPWPNG